MSRRTNGGRLAGALLAFVLTGVVTACTHPLSTRASGTRCETTSRHHDGDTFTCEPKEEAQFVVRVASIDAPETGQAYWRVAGARLRELAAPGSFVDCYKVDRYERWVCRLKTKDGEDAANLLLLEGLAWYPEDFANEDLPDDRERYRRLQVEAKAAKLGLWAEPDPMPPKDCRQRRRTGLSCR